ncbi:MAG: succinylglutamate desuccinylase/aspartoacylase family protein [Pseudomonadota bacterium]
MTVLRAGLLVLTLMMASGCAVANEDLDTIAGVSIEPGQRVDVTFDVPAGETDAATFIPVTILRGAADGPTALMVAGVHGYEFAPMLAAERLAESLSPETMTGNFIIVRVAHVPCFRRPFGVRQSERSQEFEPFVSRQGGRHPDRAHRTRPVDRADRVCRFRL